MSVSFSEEAEFEEDAKETRKSGLFVSREGSASGYAGT
jgi:hypothetical protein